MRFKYSYFYYGGVLIFRKLFNTIKEYRRKPPREKKLALYANLWFTPIAYTGIAILLFALAAFVDLQLDIGEKLPPAITISYQLTQTILSTLTAGILSLTTFTFYGVLAALTTFSVQFSPRILKNFMMGKVTQRTLGIFIGSFHYVLLCLLFINEEDSLFFIPIVATAVTILSMITFIIFINHIVTWLQVTTMTDNMKEEAAAVAKSLLVNEMYSYRVEDPETIKNQIPGKNHQSYVVKVENSGYIQIIDFISILKEAEKDNIIIQLENKVGDYAFQSTPLFTYWKKENTSIDESKYYSHISIGRTQSEVQDLEFSLSKLVEIAIRSIGNNDPKTAIRTIYQIGDLLIKISNMSVFTPYLADDKENLRLILQNLTFRDYLYIGLASIRHYARKDVILTAEILKVLSSMAEVDYMAEVDKTQQQDAIWEFAEYTTRSLEINFIHSLDREKLYYTLFKIAETTGYEKEYGKLVNSMLNAMEDSEDKEELKRKFPLADKEEDEQDKG